MINPKTYNILTFGCQMNERDSERISDFLNKMGLSKNESDYDFIIINTCTVRENANNKLYGHLGLLKSQKKKNPNLKIAVCGCMMNEEGASISLMEKYPFVDMIFGTQNIEKFPMLYEKMLTEGKISDVEPFTHENKDPINTNHKYPFKSGVNIMFGCNNFCTYCIVPYVRGRERSRKPEDIISEIKTLCNDNVTEVMLLGQNVNSYGKTLENPITFSNLLERISQIDNLKRIRFMTSHPKDLSDDLIDQIAYNDKICKHIHLPLQSGSSRILELMNRHYSKEDYLTLVDKLRNKCPDIAITTDIIVGFPMETYEDFLETYNVCQAVKFDSAFTFVYSKRKGTKAANMESFATEAEIKERFDMLLELIRQSGKERLERVVGRTEIVLAEHVNEKDNSLLTGRTDQNFVVHFKGNQKEIGSYIPVYIKESKGFYFMGERI